MNNELLSSLEYIAQSRGISRDQLVSALENALLTASRKSVHPASSLEIKFDPVLGEFRAWAKLAVVEEFPNNDQILLSEVRKKDPNVQVGDIVNWEVTPRDFGRIAAQTARHAMSQLLRKIEKGIVQQEFQGQVGEIVYGTVNRIESGAIIVDLQKSEGIISSRDRVPGEQYQAGDRISAVLIKVDIECAGPSLILSRSSATFVKKLFEREVSEIHDGIVEIVGVAREAGARTKIAVRSNDERVDPVGACVGMRGMRVKSITNELGGEKIDIIPYAADPKVFLANAMHPAKLKSMEVDSAKHLYRVHVDEENSRLAFGKRAQNVRLAQKLLGWSIEIVIDAAPKEDSFEEQKAHAVEQLIATLSISEDAAKVLVANGYSSVDGLKGISAAELEKTGIDVTIAEQIEKSVAVGNKDDEGNASAE